MNLPAFSAEASIYRPNRSYSPVAVSVLAPGARVVPAWCNSYCKGGECYTRCCDCYAGECNCWTTLPRPI